MNRGKLKLKLLVTVDTLHIMASSSKRVRLCVRDNVSSVTFENDDDSDVGGMSSGEESLLNQELWSSYDESRY